MKAIKRLAIMAVAAVSVAFAACSDNDDPQPKLQPGEIPMLTEAPTQYLGEEFMDYDTISRGWAADMGFYTPFISVYESADDKTETVSKYEDDFSFVLESDGREYRVGSGLPASAWQNPIGHIHRVYGSDDSDYKALALGTFTRAVDHRLTMSWPQKNVTIYIRILLETKQITLPEVWHGQELHEEERPATAYRFGMFVNGVCVKFSHLNIVLQPDGTVRLFGRPDGLKL